MNVGSMNKNIILAVLIAFFISVFVGYADTSISSNIAQNSTWTVEGSPYIITKDITVYSGATLSIEPGCEVRFAYNTSLTVKGRLSAIGYANTRIIFTSNDASPTSPRWGSVSISTLESNQPSYISNCDFYFGGRNMHAPLIVNTPSYPQIDGLTFFNNKFNAVEITSAILGIDATIPNIGLPYLVINEFVVPRERVLNIESGVVLKFNTLGLLRVNGIINALGNENQPIVMTSVRDDYADGFDSNNDGLSYGQNGDWGGAVVDNPSAAARSTFVNCRFAFAGGSPKSRYSTIDVEYSTVVAEACTFERSARLGILIGTNGRADLGGGISMGRNCFLDFNSNGNYAISNQSTAEVPAQNNFWQITDSAAIARLIYDRSSDPAIGAVPFFPYLFSCRPAAPETPQLIAPADNSTETEMSLVFKWKKVMTAYSYSFQLSKISDFSSFVVNVSDITDTSFFVNGLEANTIYYWRVRAGNSTGQSSWSTAWRFSTRDTKPPDAPVLVSPLDGAAGLPCSLTFLWERPLNAQSFRFQIAEDPGFAIVLADEENIASNNRDVLNLENNKEYFWRVKAKNANGFGPWSAVRSFSTKLYPDTLLPVPFSWEYTNRTGQNMSIFVGTEANSCLDCVRIKPGDAVGVFFENDTSVACAGYAYWFGQTGTVLVAWGDNSSTPAKDGFDYREPLRFKLWDAQEGRVIDVVAVPESGVNYYLPDSMLVVKHFRRLTEQSINLTAGTWTIVSSSVLPSDPAMDFIVPDSTSIISNVLEDYVFLRENLHEIRKWNISEGYQVFSSKGTSLRILGTDVSPSIPLKEKTWAILPYYPKTEIPPAEALATIKDKILFMHSTDGSVFAPKFNVNQIATMKPGEGYKIILSSASALEYPNSYGGAVGASYPILSAYRHENTGVHSALILQSSDFNDGDEVFIMDTIGKNVGSGIATNQICALVAYGHDIFNPEIKDGAMEGETLSFAVRRKESMEIVPLVVNRVTDLLSGTDLAPVCYYKKNALHRVDLSAFTPVESSADVFSSVASPDPANREVSITLPIGNRKSIRVYNSLGADLTESLELAYSISSVQITVSSLPSGVYAAVGNCDGRRIVCVFRVAR